MESSYEETYTPIEVANLLKALGHPVRVEVIMILHSSPIEATVSSLAQAIECSLATMSKHLKILVEHKILESRREGNHRFFKLARPEIGNLISEMAGEQDQDPEWYRDL